MEIRCESRSAVLHTLPFILNDLCSASEKAACSRNNARIANSIVLLSL
ncbi:MAG: hypothetical protein OCU24_05145 [Candidatus Methanospirare jalkutatii]|nr:hypothetical protein [Candidatus Methanospirare jalkutatii]